MRPLLIVPLLVSFTHSPAIAYADEIAAKTAADRADALKQEGKLAESCSYRELAAKEAPDFKRKWAVGICWEDAGKTATAWVFYDAALQFARAESSLHPADDLLQEQARRAKIKVDDIATKVPKLQLVVTDRLPGLAISRGADAIAEQYWGSQMPLDPGDYTIVASAPGYQKFEAKITLKVGSVLAITIPKLPCEHAGADGSCTSTHVAFAPSASPAPAPSTSVAPTPSTNAMPTPKSGGVPALTWVFGGAGVTSLAASGIFALIGNSDWSAAHANGHCAGSNICNAGDIANAKNATTFGTLTGIAFVAGIVLVAGGVTVLAIGGGSESAPKSSLLVTPGGLSVVGSF